MLLEEYIGLGRWKDSGGWLGHYARWYMHEFRLHMPFSKPKPGEEETPTSERSMTTQQQEEAHKKELAADELKIAESRRNAET